MHLSRHVKSVHFKAVVYLLKLEGKHELQLTSLVCFSCVQFGKKKKKAHSENTGCFQQRPAFPFSKISKTLCFSLCLSQCCAGTNAIFFLCVMLTVTAGTGHEKT